MTVLAPFDPATSADILPFKPTPRELIGPPVLRIPRCPHCGENAGPRTPFVAVGPAHWAFCDTHKVRWFVGQDITPIWRDFTPNQWDADRRILERDYTEIEVRSEPNISA